MQIRPKGTREQKAPTARELRAHREATSPPQPPAKTKMPEIRTTRSYVVTVVNGSRARMVKMTRGLTAPEVEVNFWREFPGVVMVGRRFLMPRRPLLVPVCVCWSETVRVCVWRERECV